MAFGYWSNTGMNTTTWDWDTTTWGANTNTGPPLGLTYNTPVEPLSPGERDRLNLRAARPLEPGPLATPTEAGALFVTPVYRPRRSPPSRGHMGWIRRRERRPL